MILELLLRFIIGGLVACAFAVIGVAVKPTSLRSILGATPSVALATLGPTFFMHGGQFASVEGRWLAVCSSPFRPSFRPA